MPRSLPTLALALTLVTVVSPARAHWGNLGRHLGCGWSDGYHAANHCAITCTSQVHGWPPAGAESPWWMSPLPQAEPLPHPAHPYNSDGPQDPPSSARPAQGHR